MCNITGYFFRESVPDRSVLKNLCSYGKLRGTDGFGLFLGTKNTYKILNKTNKVEDQDKLIDRIFDSKDVKIGDIFLSNNRAAPETEFVVDDTLLNDSLQPIYSMCDDIVLVHNGSVSNFIYKELLKKEMEEGIIYSKIDSEAIIWTYMKYNRNIKPAMEYLSGGFAFLMLDLFKYRLYVVCTHNPLYTGYVKGQGMFWSTSKDAIWSTISKLKNTPIYKNNQCIWEDFYCRSVNPYTIEEIDLDSGMIMDQEFQPRYIHPKWDPYLSVKSLNTKKKVLISCSSGLDSTTALVTLKEADYDCEAIHFKYGHRGEDCEEEAVRTICTCLKVPLKIIDIHNVKEFDYGGILTNEKEDILTGTEENTKTTYAWTVFRNHFFLTYMGAYAESLILQQNLNEVFLTGGFLQLSESASYGDNTERFLESGIDFFKYSITGTRIKPIFGLCNLLKWEQLVLLKKLNYLYLLNFTISCDRPKMINGVPKNCSFFNEETIRYEPACGSGRRSWYSTQLAGVNDTRQYYLLDNLENYNPYKLPTELVPIKYNIKDILNKLEIHDDNLKILKNKFNII